MLDRSSRVIGSAPLNGENLGPPSEDLRDVGHFRVASRPLLVGNVGGGSFQSPTLDRRFAEPVGYVQYARPTRGPHLHHRPHQGLPRLRRARRHGAGLPGRAAVARRAMRPVTRLTAGAREVARTRDPSTTLPKPSANDEVADLAHTLEDMLGELGAAGRRPRPRWPASASSWPTPRTSCAPR